MTLLTFPGPAYAWAFVATLIALLATAAVLDLKSAIIPKQLSLAMLLLGLVANVARAATLAGMAHSQSETAPGVLGGAFSGLLFSLGGFAFGFAAFFILWVLGAAGGGDVKLFAALGAWVGWKLSLFVLLGTLVVVALIVLGQAAKAMFGGNWKRLQKRKPRPDGKPSRRLLTFALPVAIAAAFVITWALRLELGLVPVPA